MAVKMTQLVIAWEALRLRGRNTGFDFTHLLEALEVGGIEIENDLPAKQPPPPEDD